MSDVAPDRPEKAPRTPPGRAETATVEGLAVTRRRPEQADPFRPTVLLVHGAMDRGASFGRTMRRLGELDVITLDRRGYAGSLDAGTAGSLAAHAADLSSVIDWSGASQVVVVGHSLGGTIGLQLAALADRRVVALGAFESPVPELDDSFDEVGGGAVDVGEREGPEAAAEFFYRLMVGDQTWDRLRERDRLARRAEGPALLAELMDLRRRDRSVDLGAVDLPLVVGLGGTSSRRLRSSSTLLHSAIGSSTLVEIPGAGHGAHLTHPDEFARYVAGVAAAQGRAGRSGSIR